ncbi:MAG: YciI family protein [Massilia sp.]
MQFMIMRKSDLDSEAGGGRAAQRESAWRRYRDELAEAGVLRGEAALTPSAAGLRLHLGPGGERIEAGPFAALPELVDRFSIIEVDSRAEAMAWAARWPAEDAEAELEVRETGCPGGCLAVTPGAVAPAKQRFAILLRSDAEHETGIPPAQHKLDTLDRSNAEASAAGILLAADGLQPSARGARVSLKGGRPSTVDGPFTEVKELIAGYWLIQAASLDEAIAWARRNPYPTGPDVLVEIRPLSVA